MQGILSGIYIPRNIEKELLIALGHVPVTALIGPRQCGKSTLAKKIINNLTNVVYTDGYADIEMRAKKNH